MVDRGAASGRPLSDAGPGLFGPGSITWQLDREAFLLLGAGPRALLLQIAHPAVAAGVDEHSTFRADPWGRLAGTLRSYLRIVYGSTVAARAEIRRLNDLHAGVRGALPGGGSYRARDPELSLWVHATLIDSTIATADAWLGRLDASARARAYAESLPVGRAFGIPASLLPADVDAFDAYVASMIAPSGPVQPGPLARELAATILHPPPGPAIRTLAASLAGSVPGPLVDGIAAAADALPPSAVAWLLWPSIGLLPPSTRRAYELPWGPRERAVSAWLVTAWRAWARLLPEAFRQMPQALAADRRTGVGGER
jgi:uncharacterized protein (DUF2236 family)